jgi:hypothetical protein
MAYPNLSLIGYQASFSVEEGLVTAQVGGNDCYSPFWFEDSALNTEEEAYKFWLLGLLDSYPELDWSLHEETTYLDSARSETLYLGRAATAAYARGGTEFLETHASRHQGCSLTLACLPGQTPNPREMELGQKFLGKKSLSCRVEGAQKGPDCRGLEETAVPELLVDRSRKLLAYRHNGPRLKRLLGQEGNLCPIAWAALLAEFLAIAWRGGEEKGWSLVVIDMAPPESWTNDVYWRKGQDGVWSGIRDAKSIPQGVQTLVMGTQCILKYLRHLASPKPSYRPPVGIIGRSVVFDQLQVDPAVGWTYYTAEGESLEPPQQALLEIFLTEGFRG